MVNQLNRVIESSGVTPVIKYGYCVGCGACAGLEDSCYEMVETPFGTLEARKSKEITKEEEEVAGSVCPFSDRALNEDQLSKEIFEEASNHEKLGRYMQTYAGYVRKGSFREMGSSGGLGTWILEQLLAQGYVDAVVHVAKQDSHNNKLLYGYKISRSIKELRQGSKSKYYPVTLASIINQVRMSPGRYAFTGVPCFIKAIRLLTKNDPGFGKSVSYCLGLICGHLKSRGYSEFLAWQLGISPDNLTYFDFRVKLKNKPANKYGVLASGTINGSYLERIGSMEKLFGRDWGMGLFKLKACDYCDDVVAETADVTVGDAWLPRYVGNNKGTNIVIVRDKIIADIISQGIKKREIWLESIDPEDVIESQGSGYSHRREGLSYRLWFADANKYWRPKKRVNPQVGLHGEIFEERHRLRLELAKLSHEAFLDAKSKSDLSIFFKRIIPLSEKYLDISRTPIKRVLTKIKRTGIGNVVTRCVFKKY